MPTEPIAMVQQGFRDLVETPFEAPRLEPGAAFLELEACGLCGSDIEALEAIDNAPSRDGSGLHLPRIMGHEIVGTVVEIGEGGRRDANVGDRVAVDPWLPCGGCEHCLAGQSMFCIGWDFSPACYGFISTDVAPALWGGYATHLYAHPKTVLYRIPDHVEATKAALWNPLGAGIEWAVRTPGTTLGTTLAVLGSGQRGLCSVAAAKAAGAAQVIVTGLSKDAEKLELAKRFGADLAIDVEAESAVERIEHLTDGRGVDVVVDTSANSTAPISESLKMVRAGGTIVLAGLKNKPVPEFEVDQTILKGVTIRGTLGVDSSSYRHAVRMLAEDAFPITAMQTHRFDFRDAVTAVDTLSRGSAINVTLTMER
jgi:threonine dehydrogenase-like Zn-dependent dehydrogenase